MPSFSELIAEMSAAAQQNQPGRAPAQQQSAGYTMSVSESTAEIAELRKTVDQLSLACESMWRLLSEHLGFTDDNLRGIIRALDEADGNIDGSYQPPPGDCSCGAKVNASSDMCQFCGAAAERRKLF